MIEIGQDENSPSFIRVLDSGGMVWESKPNYKSLDDALNDLEAALENDCHLFIMENLMPLFIECVSADDLRYEHDITLGEICNTLRGVWGDATLAPHASAGERVAQGF